MNAATVGTVVTALLNAGYEVRVARTGTDGQGNGVYKVIASGGAVVTVAVLSSFATTYGITATTGDADFT